LAVVVGSRHGQRSKGTAMQNRAPRCGHGFYVGLCAVAACQHFDGGQTEAPPPARPDQRKPAYRGASLAVRALLLTAPTMSSTEITQRCSCSLSLVSLVRRQLGLQRMGTKPQRWRVPGPPLRFQPSPLGVSRPVRETRRTRQQEALVNETHEKWTEEWWNDQMEQEEKRELLYRLLVLWCTANHRPGVS
jgi:hypothetical protein